MHCLGALLAQAGLDRENSARIHRPEHAAQRVSLAFVVASHAHAGVSLMEMHSRRAYVQRENKQRPSIVRALLHANNHHSHR